MKKQFKMNLQLFAENRVGQIETRLAEIRETLTKGEGNIDELEKEINDLQEERKGIEERERRQRIADGLNIGEIEGRSVEKPKEELEQPDEMEKRGKDLKENRAILVSSESIVLPKHDSSTINPTFNEISSLVDRVRHMDLPGGESFDQPYIIRKSGEGAYTGEEQDYHDVEPEFGYARIGKTKVTAYSEVSEEMEKLPAADYAGVVESGVGNSIKKKLTRQILVGNGETDNIVGIFSSRATAINPVTDKEISVIDENTLDEVIFSYGGDEDVEDVAVLILNKADLKEFAMLRYPDGRKVYEVKTNGNTGTINSVPYIINSVCSSITNGVEGEYCMAYGPLSNYTFATFSPLEVMKSSDYRFKQGMIAHKGSVFTGGNVTSYNGFLRVKKGLGE